MKFFLTFCILVMSLALSAEHITLWGVDQGGYFRWEYSITKHDIFVQIDCGGQAYYTFWYEKDGTVLYYNNWEYRGKPNGTLKWVMNGSSNYCTGLEVKVCPNTDYCQPSACGGGCSVHGSAGAGCVQVTCSKCGTSYCMIHQKHICSNWTCCKGKIHLLKATVAFSDVLPDLSTLGSNKVCASCSEMYCSICGHTCTATPINTTPSTDPTTTANQILQNQATQLQSMANNMLAMSNYLQSIQSLTQGNAQTLSSLDNSLTGLKNEFGPILEEIRASSGTLSANFITYMQEFDTKTDQIINNTSAINTTVTNIDTTVTTISSQLDGLQASADDMLDLMDDQIAAIEELTAQFKTNDTLPGKRDMATLKDNTSVFDTLKNKLLPSFSLFTISGCEWPEWQIIIPVSAVAPGLSDFTMVVGGQSWTTVAGGFIPKIAHISRSLSYLVFTFMFIFAVIRALRQW